MSLSSLHVPQSDYSEQSNGCSNLKNRRGEMDINQLIQLKQQRWELLELEK
jgi:hypothetical protein